MAGTVVRVVESIGSLTDKESHNKVVYEAVGDELKYGMRVDSATTTAVITPRPDEILRITTIVFVPTLK